ncbi:Protein phosphatase 1 regulatory subunit 11 [Intoshia linei]|uniref:E3 ubiquitin-protein ligase PPP1R11 n=1 Tax=Intoshia linei TaxID=1819745 RepID=A0A177B8L3_9BILA|nr:Protein phosphatase 1 regulatory subunit 11 [Intoshia linei]
MDTKEVTESTVITETETQTVEETETPEISILRLETNQPSTSQNVQWTDDTIDNEHLNKKKSKCCCIYRKPHKFGESGSDSEDDDCKNCRGHKNPQK